MEINLSLLDSDNEDEEFELQKQCVLHDIKQYEEVLRSESITEKSAFRGKVPITATLIAEHCLDIEAKKKDGDDEIIEAIFKLTHVRLENLLITDIDGIECITGTLTHLYLDSNRIKDMSEVQWLDKLTTLVLSNNKIEEIEGISELQFLKTINLSNNKLKPFNVIHEIPTSVMTADFTGNDLLCHQEIRDSLLLHLHNPQKINGIDCQESVSPKNNNGAELPHASTLTFGSEKFVSEVDSVREVLLSDYQKKISQRNAIVDRLLDADVDEIDEFTETDKIIKEYKQQRDNKTNQRRDDSDLLKVALHKCKLASASLNEEYSNMRDGIRSRKMEILSRAADRREKLITDGDSAAFIRAKAVLEKEQTKQQEMLKTKKGSNEKIPKVIQ